MFNKHNMYLFIKYIIKFIMGKFFKKKINKLQSRKNNKHKKLNINPNYSIKFIIYKPYSILLNEKKVFFNNLKKANNSYKIKTINSLIKEFDLDENMMNYYFSLLYQSKKLYNSKNITKFIKYMFVIPIEDRIKYQI